MSLYLYVADHLRSLVERHLERGALAEITDFFDMLDYGAEEKLRLFRRQPWILNLALRLYYVTDKEVASPLRRPVHGDAGGDVGHLFLPH